MGAKCPHCNFDYMNKIEVRANTIFYQLGCLNNTPAQTFYILSFFMFFFIPIYLSILCVCLCEFHTRKA